MPEIFDDIEMKQLELVQNRLAASMIKQAKEAGLVQGKDWVQGGWSRSKDKVDFGFGPSEVLTATDIRKPK